MNIEFYNKKTGELQDPEPDYMSYVVNSEGEVVLICFNMFGQPNDLEKDDSVLWRVVEEISNAD